MKRQNLSQSGPFTRDIEDRGPLAVRSLEKRGYRVPIDEWVPISHPAFRLTFEGSALCDDDSGDCHSHNRSDKKEGIELDLLLMKSK
jgi:hypothetical protein